MIKEEVAISKSNYACMWEKGGYDPSSKKGYCQLITNRAGDRKMAMFVNYKDEDSEPNGEHALIAIQENDLVLRDFYIAGKHMITVYRALRFEDENDKKYVLLEPVWTYNGTKWNTPSPCLKQASKYLHEVLDTLINKSETENCTKGLYYIFNVKKKNA
jgi:hypothetical protein